MRFSQAFQQALTEFTADGTAPAQINNGECDLFVDRVMELCPEAGGGETDFETEPGHVYLTHEGRCYDAECPEGVTDYRDLPAIRR